jgi:outer membrane immunogenic protein
MGFMKKVLLTSAALLMVASGSAMAADLARPVAPAPAPYVPPPSMVPVFSWTGLYVGLDGGYGFGRSDGSFTKASGTNQVGYAYSVTGPLAGGFVGGNYQWGMVVFGAEADWQWSDLTGNSGTITGFAPAVGNSMSSTVKWYGSARGRLGLALDHWLFYGTAGWAFGDWSTSYTRSGGAVSNFTNSASSHNGWTAGAGVEYAFTNYLTGRVEYRYTDLGTSTFTDVPSDSGEAGNKVTIQDVRAGLAFKFW